MGLLNTKMEFPPTEYDVFEADEFETAPVLAKYRLTFRGTNSYVEYSIFLKVRIFKKYT